MKKSSRFFAHSTAVIEDACVIGKGTKVWHFSHVMNGARIGENCVLGQNVYVGPGVSIGDGVKVQNNVSIFEGVKLEDDVFIGPSVVFTNVLTPRAFISRKHEFECTIVKKGTTIGANATIVCGVTLGKYSFVGAGAVVTREIKPHALVVGTPACQIGWVCICGRRLTDKLFCMSCKAVYRLGDKGTVLLPNH